MEQEDFKIKDMIAEKKAMESTIKDMLELFTVKYDVKEISVDGMFEPCVKTFSGFSQIMNTYLNIEVSGNATRTHEQLPNHNILTLFQFR